MSNDREYTHYIVVNEVVLGDASIIEKLNDWVSLAFVRLGIGGSKLFTDYAFVENHTLVPKILTSSPNLPTHVVKSIHQLLPPHDARRVAASPIAPTHSL